ncbi:mannitol dehydrogenase family protein [Lichenicoccus roseus]|uniref:Mannitol dehydrogenase family protein n=1 Tax=Lichenicoccus roseus TaxID=2683649 RepID=A0A5R9J6G1_9PROT|nr:mannitol dehydrogenase family protein [Lichenicoccus roseus]TLU73210.1 mannitol dehydrogenase family protein [Lichenicoccus roseus]
MTVTPIVQFGTSRFLQAHVDLFVSEALASGDAPGPITVVQTTDSADSARRVAAFNAGPFPVQIRGLENGAVVDRRVEVSSVTRALQAARDWDAIEDIVVHEARVLVSNTAERGYDLHPDDAQGPLHARSFPARLARLLLARYRHRAEPLEMYPCELQVGNGGMLRDIVLAASREWDAPDGFREWLQVRCRWVNTLVDRIVPTPLQPIGAVAEPYALWAIEAQPGLVPFCRHPCIEVAASLERYEQRKLFILNLGHSVLVSRWQQDGLPPEMTVREILEIPEQRDFLDAVHEQEVLPVFAAVGDDGAPAYRATTMDRFRNPFLDHRLADIARNHESKVRIRIGGVLDLARRVAPEQRMDRLRAVLQAAA